MPRLLMHYPPYAPEKAERLARHRRRRRRSHRRRRLAGRRPRTCPPRSRATAPPRSCWSSSTSACTAPASRRPPARCAWRRSSPRCPRSRWPASPATRATAAGDAATVRARLMDADALLRETRDAFIAAGIRCDRISGGSTPTRYLTHETCVTELRSRHLRAVRPQRPARRRRRAGRAVRLVTVISDAVPDQIVVDAGSKTLTSDSHDDGGHGIFIGLPGARLHDINEEHGYVDVAALDERPAGRRPPPDHPEPRLRLREPARRPARRPRRRRRGRCCRLRARGLIR